MFVNDLAHACRSSGLRVWEDPAWQRRNHGQMSGVRGVICHHTGSSSTNAWVVVRDGRSGLPGPLAQMTLERDGLVRVLANGLSYHAGTGSWPGIGANGNAWLLGIEAVYNGSDITQAQRDAYPRLCAALARHYRFPVDKVIAHREWAPRRKIDPGNVDMNTLRAQTARYMNSPQEDDMDGRQNKMLEEIHSQMFGPWDTFRYGDKGPKMTLVDFVRSIDRELNTRFSLDGRPTTGPDTPVGHVLNLAKQLADALDALEEKP